MFCLLSFTSLSQFVFGTIFGTPATFAAFFSWYELKEPGRLPRVASESCVCFQSLKKCYHVECNAFSGLKVRARKCIDNFVGTKSLIMGFAEHNRTIFKTSWGPECHRLFTVEY